MTENPQDPQSNTVTPSPQTQNSENMVPQSRFSQVNEERKQYLAELETLRLQLKQENDAKLAQDNQWRELAEQRQREIEQLKSVQSEVENLRQSFQSTLEARLERIPEEKRKYLPEFDDPIKLSAYLDKAEDLFIEVPKPTAPKTDGGAGLPDYTGVKLNDMELQYAAAAGMSPEQYAAQKAKRGQAPPITKPTSNTES